MSFPEPPSSAVLATGLAEILGEDVAVLERAVNPRSSRFLSEVVRCRTATDRALRLFCKYEAGPVGESHGLRGGVAYEAEVYRRVLVPSALPMAPFHGARRDAASGLTWLVLGLVEADRLGSEHDAVAAARWLARFHSAGEGLPPAATAFLTRYDAAIYRDCARRAAYYCRTLAAGFPWFPPLCAAFEDLIPVLTEAAPTVIHGEFYPVNVLCAAGRIVPVDWESAALAPGEIDLAHLVDRWASRTVARSIAAYTAARWPAGVSPDVDRRLGVARLYVQLRWLAEREDWALADNTRWRFEALHAAGARLGLVDGDRRVA
jgi:hypothetical protein